MFRWIKEILSYGSGEFSGNGALPPIRTPPLPMPKVKPCKGNDISEPVISFLKTVRENPKRFNVGSDCSAYIVYDTGEIPNYKAYKIWDKKLDKGWYIRGSRYTGCHTFLFEYNPKGLMFCNYEHAFFLTEDEKEYLIQEISGIMNYRIDRKAKLDKIRADRRIRDTRNKLKELYK